MVLALRLQLSSWRGIWLCSRVRGCDHNQGEMRHVIAKMGVLVTPLSPPRFTIPQIRSAQLQYSSGVPSTYLASRPVLGRDGQNSEGIAGHWQRTARRMTRVELTTRRTTDHEDSRRLASGLSADLSRIPGAGRQREEHVNENVIGRGRFHDLHQQDPYQRSYPSDDGSGLGRQADPGDRRTSDWRSPTLEGNPDVGLEQSHFTPRDEEGDTARNASRILITGSRRPGQCGVTTHNAAWLTPVIPNRLMMLLSGTDNRPQHMQPNRTSRYVAVGQAATG